METATIYNKARYEQNLIFKGTESKGNMHLSDIDGCMDIQGKYFITVEVKTGSTKLPLGQKITLTTMTDALQRGGYKKAIIIVARHNTDVREDIHLKDCYISEFYMDGKWKRVNFDISYNEFIGRFAYQNKIERLKDLWVMN